MKALEAGCEVLGRQRGGGIYGLEGWLGGRTITDFLTPTDEGFIELLLLAQLSDWQAGQLPVNQVSPH